jgi:A/G-specific adenine glycosylase
VQKRLVDWGKKNYSEFPWRSTSSFFHALVAEIMLQRTRAEQVLRVYEEFVKKYPTVKAAAMENRDKIRQLLLPLGLRWRTEMILELIDHLASGTKIFIRQDEFSKLPGVGPYVKNILLSTQLDVKAPVIDRNAVRLWSRILGFNVDAETQKKKWFVELTEQLTPNRDFKQFNFAVLDFTRIVCRPRPKCSICPLTSYCNYFDRRK